MPTRRYAHLLLPSSLGLLEYDILEDAVFLGPGKRGGLEAKPTPFPKACVALTRSEAGFVARPLPGEAPPEINGAVVDDHLLADGDRVRIGDQVALFRTAHGPLPTARTPPQRRASDAGARTAGRRVASAGARGPDRRVATGLGLLGAALLLAATVRAVGYLKEVKDAQVRTELPPVPEIVDAGDSAAARMYAVLRAYEQNNPHRYERLVQRYQAFIDKFADSAEVDSAQERIRELMEAWGAQERGKLEEELDRLAEARRFDRTLGRIREFEASFGATRAGQGTQVLRERVREQAREALDELLRGIEPLIESKPKAAHRRLVAATIGFPPDMAAEVAALMERAASRIRAEKRTGPRAPVIPERAPPPPPEPAPEPGGERPPVVPDEPSADAHAKETWRLAQADLVAGRYDDALRGYIVLTQKYGTTPLYREQKSKINAGLYAARVGSKGPAGLVSVPVTERKGRLELEYTFDSPVAFEEDFSQEQPFASEHQVGIEHQRGHVRMSGASGLLHRLVFTDEVRVEANVTAHVAHDFGLLAIEEADAYRAVLLNVANTKFKLKKGDAATVNPGHLLWYIGEGVWKDADPGEHGFIKIAERTTSKLQDGDRVQLELIRRKNDVCEGGFGAKTDGVHLKGKVRGDDGSTMGSARVGVYTNSGIIGVHQLRISGVVDMTWFKKHLAFLVAADPGPE